MSAVTFLDALDAVMRRPCTPAARACVRALEGPLGAAAGQLIEELDVPVLRKVHRCLLEPCTAGQLVGRVLRLRTVQVIQAGVELATGRRLSRERAAELHADCWLALSEWVLFWNRSQVRRVA